MNNIDCCHKIITRSLVSLRIFLVYTLSVYGLSWASAQNWSNSSLHSLMPYKDIAAYGGMDRVTSISGQVRKQWNEFDRSPAYQYIGIHTPVYIWSGAVGMELMNQTQGAIRLRRARASYNYVMPTFGGLLSAGVRLGILQGELDGSILITPEGNYADGIVDHNDPLLSSTISSGTTFTHEISIAYTMKDLFVGASLSDLPINRLRAGDGQIAKHPQLNSFFRYFFRTDYNIDIQATAFVKTDFVTLQSEITSLAKINGNIFGGITLRGYSSSTVDAIGFIVGHSLNDKLSIFYSYDLGISELRTEHQGSHELMIKYRWQKLWGTGLPPKIIYNPRFL